MLREREKGEWDGVFLVLMVCVVGGWSGVERCRDLVGMEGFCGGLLKKRGRKGEGG